MTTERVTLDADVGAFNRSVDSAIARASAAMKKLGGTSSSAVQDGVMKRQLAAMDKAVEGIGRSDMAAKAAAGKFAGYATETAMSAKATNNVFGQLQAGISNTIGKFTGLIGTIGGVVAALYTFKAGLEKGADWLIDRGDKARTQQADMGLLLDNRGDKLRLASAARSMGLVGPDGKLSASARTQIIEGLLARGGDMMSVSAETDKLLAELAGAMTEYAARAAVVAYQNRLAEHAAFVDVAGRSAQVRATAEKLAAGYTQLPDGTWESPQERRFRERGERVAASGGPSGSAWLVPSISGAMGAAGNSLSRYGALARGYGGVMANEAEAARLAAGEAIRRSTDEAIARTRGEMADARVANDEIQRTTSDAWANALQSPLSAVDSMKESILSLDEALLGVATGAGMQALTTGVTTAMDAWITGTESVGTAVKAAVASMLKEWATQSMVRSLMELGEGFASLALGPVGGVSATGHFKASAIFAGVAAAAGLASKGAYSAGWGGSDASAASSPSATSYAGGARSGNTGGPVTYVLNFSGVVGDKGEVAVFMVDALKKASADGRVLTGDSATEWD